MADVSDVASIFSNFSDGLIKYSPQLKIALLIILGLLFIVNLKYIAKGTEALIKGLMGYKKMVVVGNDKQFRALWVKFSEDYKLCDDKAYIHDKTQLFTNEFGEQIEMFTQDFTEPIEFKPYKKYVWIDKRTNLPLKDKEGKYVSKLNISQYLSLNYHKELSEEFRKIEDLIQPTLLDNVVKKQVSISDVMFPSKLLESKKGIDSSLTAQVIIRRMKIDSIGWLSKYWKYIMIFGLIVGIGTIIIFALSYGNAQKLDVVSKQIVDMASQLKSLLPKNLNPSGG